MAVFGLLHRMGSRHVLLFISSFFVIAFRSYGTIPTNWLNPFRTSMLCDTWASYVPGLLLFFKFMLRDGESLGASLSAMESAFNFLVDETSLFGVDCVTAIGTADCQRSLLIMKSFADLRTGPPPPRDSCYPVSHSVML